MAKHLLYGGKGGVGKTTCAAATGLRLADRGERTLLVSTDPAHSLGDVFGTELGGDPTRIEGDLWGVEASPETGQETYRALVEALAAEFRAAGVRLTGEDVDRLFGAGFVPGSDEIAALEFLVPDVTDRDWDRVVLDTAPTGHTLRLLSLPAVLRESLTTAAKVRGEVRRLVDSARSLVFGPAAFLGGEDGRDAIDAFRDRMEGVAARLRDPERTAVRVVLLPEALAVEETGRLVERLRDDGIAVEALLVNRVVRDPPGGCGRCRERARSHETRIEEVRARFPETDVRVLPELGPEVTGRDALERLAAELEG